MTESQQTLLSDKLVKAAERKAKAEKRKSEPAEPTADAVYTAPVVATPVATGATAPAFLIEPRTLADYDGLAAGTLDADSAFVAAVDGWKVERERLNGLRSIDDAETITLAEIRQRRDEAEQLELTLAQQSVALCRQYVERLQARLPELRDYASEQSAKLVEVEASVTERLNAAGVSVETQSSWPYAPESAAIQFRHVLMKAADWQAQREQSSKAENQVQITADFIQPGKLRIAEAEESLRSKVTKLVA